MRGETLEDSLVAGELDAGEEAEREVRKESVFAKFHHYFFASQRSVKSQGEMFRGFKT